MATKNIPTQKEMYELIMQEVEGSKHEQSIVEFCNKRIAALTKKSTSTNAKKDAENEKYYDAIVDVLMGGDKFRTTDICKAVNAAGLECTVQKVTSMLHKMKDAGRVTQVIEKKVPLYSLVFGVAE